MQEIIRQATKEEAPFLGKVTLAALGLYDFVKSDSKTLKNLEIATNLCAMEDSLYSYRHALIATIDCCPAGAIIGYDGAVYQTLREKSFAYIREHTGIDNSQYAMETGPGEFYLDSMAIAPEFRGRELGHKLMRAAISRGREFGFNRFTLIVDVTHPRVRDYYGAVGFIPREDMQAFGGTFTKMILNE